MCKTQGCNISVWCLCGRGGRGDGGEGLFRADGKRHLEVNNNGLLADLCSHVLDFLRVQGG